MRIADPNLKYVAWDPNDCDSDDAREYTGSTPGEIATQHAEWMHGQGDPQREYDIRVRATAEGIVHEWEVCVTVKIEMSFHAATARPMNPDTVHYAHEAYQPNVHLRCGRWTTPAWSPRAELPDLVYQTDEGDLYTFERVELVTCETCRGAMVKTVADPGALS
jgi:hypothetical protein